MSPVELEPPVVLAGAARRGDPVSRAASCACAGAAAATTPAAGRALLFAAGLALSSLPLVSPLDAAPTRSLLSAHMLQHVLIGDAGPALLLLACAGPLLAFVVCRPAASRFVARAARSAWLGRPAAGCRARRLGSAPWRPGTCPQPTTPRSRRPLAPRPRACDLLSRGLPRLGRAGRPGSGRGPAVGRRAGVASPAPCSCSARLLCERAARQPAALPRVRRRCAPAARPLPLVDQQYAGLVMRRRAVLTLGPRALRVPRAASRRPLSIRGVPGSLKREPGRLSERLVGEDQSAS